MPLSHYSLHGSSFASELTLLTAGLDAGWYVERQEPSIHLFPPQPAHSSPTHRGGGVVTLLRLLSTTEATRYAAHTGDLLQPLSLPVQVRGAREDLVH